MTGLVTGEGGPAGSTQLTLSPRDLHLFKGNFDPLLHMFPKVLGS